MPGAGSRAAYSAVATGKAVELATDISCNCGICLVLEVGRLQFPDKVAAPTEYIAWKLGVGKSTIYVTLRESVARKADLDDMGGRGGGFKEQSIREKRRVSPLVEKDYIGLERILTFRPISWVIGIIGAKIFRRTKPLEVEGNSVELLRNQLWMADKEPFPHRRAAAKRKERLLGVKRVLVICDVECLQPLDVHGHMRLHQQQRGERRIRNGVFLRIRVIGLP